MSEQNTNQNEISLKEMIQKNLDYVKLLIQNWKLIVVVGVLGGILGLTYSIVKKPQYPAVSTFMLEQGGQSGAMASLIVGQLGLGGGMTLNDAKLEKIIKSRKVIALVLLKDAEINGKRDVMANHFLDMMEWTEDWEDDETLANFRFRSMSGSRTSSYTEDSVMNEIYAVILEDHILVEADKEGVLTMAFTSPWEQFSKKANEDILLEANGFFISNVVQQEKETVDIIEDRLDSVTVEVEATENSLSLFKDSHLSMIKMQGRTNEMKLMRRIEVLNILYGELIKNLEMARFNLLNNTPVIQVIDYPILPLEEVKVSKAIAIGLGGLLFGFLICAFIIGRQLYYDIMNS